MMNLGWGGTMMGGAWGGASFVGLLFFIVVFCFFLFGAIYFWREITRRK